MKTQFFSAEVISNIALFSIVFIFLLFMINNKIMNFKESTEEDYLIINSNNIINLLTLTGGYPNDWSNNNFSEIGLCDYYKIINPAKLENFIDALNNNYSAVIESFSIDAYNLYFSLEYLNNSKIIEYRPKIKPRNVLVSKRKVLYNNEPAMLKVGVLN